PRGGDLPASSGQRRLWFLARLQPDSAVYNMPMAYWLSGPWEPRWLAASLGGIVRRHEALRTTLAESPHGLPQAIPPPPPIPPELCQVDLAGLPEPLRRLAALDPAGRGGLRPLDLAPGPPLPPLLFRLSGEGE